MEKFCKVCGREMKIRTAKSSGKKFWGCSGFPACKNTEWMSYSKEEAKSRPTSGPDLEWSNQQKAIIKSFALGKAGPHLKVQATAGSGKTTTAEGGVWEMKRKHKGLKIASVAFNNSIASVLKERMPEGVVAGTLHALALKCLKTWVPKTRLDEFKSRNLLRVLLPENIEEKDAILFNRAVPRLVSLCKQLLVNPVDTEALKDLVAGVDIETNHSEDQIFEYVQKVYEESIRQHDKHDFDDMIFLPLILGFKPETYDVLIVDEAQDLNPARQQFALKSLSKDGRMIVIGDRNQAIYAFAGADTQSMDTMASLLAETGKEVIEMPLTLTRRCPKVAVARAQEIVGNAIESLPDSPEGSEATIGYNEFCSTADAPSMILCRNKAPLIPACYALLKRSVKVAIAGKDIGAGLIALITRLGAKTIPDLISRAEKYREEELEKVARRRNAEQLAEQINDRIDCLLAFTEEENTIPDLTARIQSIFAEVSGGVPKATALFSTIHRAKGLEADTVYILAPELMPSKYATTPEAIQQEQNLRFVAITRTKDALIWVSGKKQAK